LICWLIKPGFETRLTESRVIFRNQCPLTHFDTEVARLRVSDNLARIFVCRQAHSDEFIQTKLFRPAYFNGAIHWRACRDPAYRTGDMLP
jgi:hypothetical protein